MLPIARDAASFRVLWHSAVHRSVVLQRLSLTVFQLKLGIDDVQITLISNSITELPDSLASLRLKP